MKRLIYRYLNRYYGVDSWKVYSLDNNITVQSYLLVRELSNVFGLSKKQLKPYIRDWSRSKNKSFNFKGFWAPLHDNFFPIIKSVFSRTIASDLVSVQPMIAPSVGLSYLDYLGVLENTERRLDEERINSLAVTEMMHEWGNRVFSN